MTADQFWFLAIYLPIMGLVGYGLYRDGWFNK